MWLIVQLTDSASPLCFKAQGSWCTAQWYGPHPWFCDTSTLKRCVIGLLQRERKVDSLIPTSHILLVCLRPGDKSEIRWEPSIWSPLLTYIYRMAHIALICEEGWLYPSTPPMQTPQPWEWLTNQYHKPCQPQRTRLCLYLALHPKPGPKVFEAELKLK